MESILRKVEAQFVKESLTVPGVGDTVNVKIKIKEGDKERIQSFQGVVIAKQGKGLNISIKVRKISNGVGVEKTLMVHAPAIDDIEIIKVGRPRRAKLYYLRKRKGKLALKVKDSPKKRVGKLKKGAAAKKEVEKKGVTEKQVPEKEVPRSEVVAASDEKVKESVAAKSEAKSEVKSDASQSKKNEASKEKAPADKLEEKAVSAKE